MVTMKQSSLGKRSRLRLEVGSSLLLNSSSLPAVPFDHTIDVIVNEIEIFI